MHRIGWIARGSLLFLTTLCAAAWTQATAQSTEQTQVQRGPRFLMASTERGGVPTLIDAARTPALRERITLDLADVPLKDALRIVARAAKVNLFYSDDILPAGARVTLRAEGIAVAAVFTDILLDAQVDVVLMRDGRLTLAKRAVLKGPPGSGTIVGHITEATTNAAVASAQVTVVGTGLSRYTDDKGQYRIPGVSAGEREVTVRRLGFEVTSRKVRVMDGVTTTADFTMVRVATSLTEVVTTATGERSRLEVGNSVGTIRADSLVATTLIRDISDLLTARTPGVIVTAGNGLVGAPTFVRIRGQASMSMNNDPIVVLDGIRLTPASYKEASVSLGGIGIAGDGAGAWGGTNRLDDLDPNMIESIDVLRGPSASSLYGTDASTGVIVIKTKKGAAGPIRFNVLADEGQSEVVAKFPLQYLGYGHLPNNTPTAVCFLYFQGRANVVDHTCVQDSVRAYDLFNDPRLSTLGPGTVRNVSANLSGGTAQVLEFLSLRLSDAVGTGKLSAIEQSRVARQWLEPPPSWVMHPNSEQNIAMASRTNILATRVLDFSFTGNGIYRNTLTRQPGGAINFADNNENVFSGVTLGRGLYDTLIYLPAEQQRTKGETNIQRGYGAASANYTPLAWLALHGTLGGDYTVRGQDVLTRAADCTALINPNGCSSSHTTSQTQTFVTTVDVGAQATWAPRSGLSFRTSAGEQLNRTRTYSLQAGNGGALAFGTDLLTPTPVVATGSQNYNVSENRDEAATAGWYLEEMVSVRERLFLTGAFRQDVASGFGATVNATEPIYPKFSLSWLVSDEPFFPKIPTLSSFRLRWAYGHSGTQARQTAVLNNFGTGTAFADGVLVPGIGMIKVGNPLLRPERTAEMEGGFDLSLLDNERVHLEATTYRKLSNDAIISTSLPLSAGGWGAGLSNGSGLGYSQSVNLGKVENRGWELALTTKVLDSRAVAYELTVNASRNINRVVSSILTPVPAQSGCRQSNFIGYPLNPCFGYDVTGYADFNGDGILQRGEVQFDPTLKYKGSANPDAELTYTNSLRFWGGAVQVNAKIDEVIGQVSSGFDRQGTGGQVFAQKLFVPVSLAEQAAAILANNDFQGYLIHSNTVRFAELSVTGTLPKQIAARLLRARTATVTLAARNLALWTNSADQDPNMNYGSTGPDVSLSSRGGVPMPRDVTFRINLGY